MVLVEKWRRRFADFVAQEARGWVRDDVLENYQTESST
jgi:hypothetical protein